MTTILILYVTGILSVMKSTYIFAQVLQALLVIVLVYGSYNVEQQHRNILADFHLDSARIISQLINTTHENHINDNAQEPQSNAVINANNLLADNVIPLPPGFALDMANNFSSEDLDIRIYRDGGQLVLSQKIIYATNIRQEERALRFLKNNPYDEFYETIGKRFFYATNMMSSDFSCNDCSQQDMSDKLDNTPRNIYPVIAISYQVKPKHGYFVYSMFAIIFIICLLFVAIIVRKLKELDQKTKEVKVDSLTQMPNRAFVNDDIQQLFDDKTHTDENYNGIAILMLDIDNFKNINDTYGHDIGDQCLKEVANIIMNTVRIGKDIITSPNYAARWGGEEFLAILSDTSLDNAITVANRIRVEIKKHKLSTQELSITISIGACYIHQVSQPNFKHAENIADNALLSAKKNGKDCVILHQYKENAKT